MLPASTESQASADRFEKAVGPGLGSLGESIGRSKTANRLRRERYALQRGAAEILPDRGVSACGWCVQGKDTPVQLRRSSRGKARFSGLQTCGLLWICPVCADRIARVRVQEMNALLAWGRAQPADGDGRRVIPVMVTLTASHAITDALKAQVDALKKAKAAHRQRRDYKQVAHEKLSDGTTRERIIGSVTATEVTHGSAGWHTHFHQVVLVWATDQDEAVSLMQSLAPGWVNTLRSKGLDGIEQRAFQVQGAAQAGNYIAKWGAAEEVALSGRKRGRHGGRTPTQLLSDAVWENDGRARRLWKEFAAAFHGVQQLVWSRGLKRRVGIAQKDDKKAAEEGAMQEEEELLLEIEHSTWTGAGSRTFVGARHRRVRIMEAGEKGGADAARAEVFGEGRDAEAAPLAHEADMDVVDTGDQAVPSAELREDFGRVPCNGKEPKSSYEQSDSVSLASNSPDHGEEDPHDTACLEHSVRISISDCSPRPSLSSPSVGRHRISDRPEPKLSQPGVGRRRGGRVGQPQELVSADESAPSDAAG